MRARPYDIFISYRRAEGAAEARLVAAALAQHGVHAFLDVADLRRGRFDITLLNRVEEAPNFLVILTPGVRPAGTSLDDQSRVTTPAEAIRAGADFLVIGRPITAANDPAAAAREILADINRTENQVSGSSGIKNSRE